MTAVGKENDHESFVLGIHFLPCLGIGAGVFYREFTRANDFPEGEFTQLSVAHTHLLALGFMMSLIFLVLEKVWGCPQIVDT